MTPLNSILANSKIVEKRLEDLCKFSDLYTDQANKRENKETKVLLESIKFSGKIMWYYNRNQIQKMKIKKGEFESKVSIAKDPEFYIKQVLKPFSPMIKRKEINVHILRKTEFNSDIKADWKNF